MKNIHVLATDKPSRLWINNLLEGKLELSKEMLTGSNTAQHVYITSDEEIKEGDWFVTTCTNEIHKSDWIKFNFDNGKKIILTTDQDLIKDGVQAIPDEFLEWFVKNPSCEEVEVKKDFEFYRNESSGLLTHRILINKIIIPKEEPKQETFVNEKCFKCGRSQYSSRKPFCTDDFCNKDFYQKPKQETLEEVAIQKRNELGLKGTIDGFIAGYEAGYETAQQRYSEEELRQAIRKARDISDGKECFDAEDISGCTEVCTYGWKFNMSEDLIIEQFKKK